MAARAFLRLSEDLRSAFASAQDNEEVRYLRVEIVDGETLTNIDSRQRGDLKTDFDSLAQVSVNSGSRGWSPTFQFPSFAKLREWYECCSIYGNLNILSLYCSSELEQMQVTRVSGPNFCP